MVKLPLADREHAVDVAVGRAEVGDGDVHIIGRSAGTSK